MARNITVGIDIGTNSIKVAVAELLRENNKNITRVIGTGVSESKGEYRKNTCTNNYGRDCKIKPFKL